MEGERLHLKIIKENILDEIQKKNIDKKMKCCYESNMIFIENKYLKIPIAILLLTNNSISGIKTIYIFPYKTEYGKRLTIALKKSIIKKYIEENKGNYAINCNCDTMKNAMRSIGFKHSGTVYKQLYYYGGENYDEKRINWK